MDELTRRYDDREFTVYDRYSSATDRHATSIKPGGGKRNQAAEERKKLTAEGRRQAAEQYRIDCATKQQRAAELEASAARAAWEEQASRGQQVARDSRAAAAAAAQRAKAAALRKEEKAKARRAAAASTALAAIQDGKHGNKLPSRAQRDAERAHPALSVVAPGKMSMWEHVRHCAQVKHALANAPWSAVLRAALHQNEAALRGATVQLEAAKDALAATEESLRCLGVTQPDVEERG